MLNSVNRLINKGKTNKIKHVFVGERYARQSERTLTFTGTNYYVNSARPDDSGDGLSLATAKKTITAAYNAAATGSVINLVAGTYNLSAESAGYLLCTGVGKRMYFKGLGATPSDTVILQDSAASFGIRLYNCGEIVFENLKITSAQNNWLIYCDNSYDNRYFTFKNCILENTNTGSSSRILYYNESNNTYNCVIELINCTINQYITSNPGIETRTANPNAYILLKNTIINNYSNTRVFDIPASAKNKIYIYDSIFNQNYNNVICLIGSDGIGGNAGLTIGFTDIRGCIFRFSSSTKQHGLLLGRALRTGYICNNIILCNPFNDALAIGLVLKTEVINLNDLIIEGNYSEFPRPLLIKGSANLNIKNNSFISNYFNSFDFYNHKVGAVEQLSNNNLIKQNNFVSENYGIMLSNETGESQDVVTTIKTCNINNNKYYTGSGKYLYDSVNLKSINFDDKATFWGVNTNDNVSNLIGSHQLPINY